MTAGERDEQINRISKAGSKPPWRIDLLAVPGQTGQRLAIKRCSAFEINFEFDRIAVGKVVNMNHENFDAEMKVVEVQGERRERRGVNWVFLSFILIVLLMVAGFFALRMVPNDILWDLNKASNSSTNPNR